MKKTHTLILLISFIAIGCSRSSYTYTHILKTKAISSSLLNPKSTNSYLDSLLNSWDKNKHAYSIKEHNATYSDSSYVFFILQDSNSVAILLDGDKNNKIYIYQFIYPKSTWNEVDSLLTEFWNMPETIPQNAAIEDATEVELTGINNESRHRVVRTAPSVDPQFYNLVNILRFELINAASETIK